MKNIVKKEATEYGSRSATKFAKENATKFDLYFPANFVAVYIAALKRAG